MRSWHPQHPPVERVEVLVARELVARGTTCPRDERGPRQEEVEDPVPPLAVLFHDLVLVGDPVLVPLLEGERVVDADVVDLSDESCVHGQKLVPPLRIIQNNHPCQNTQNIPGQPQTRRAPAAPRPS